LTTYSFSLSFAELENLIRTVVGWQLF